MKCDLKTMLKVGAGLAILLTGVFLVFPQFRPAIIGLAPLALFALCPLSMIFMMSMNKKQDGADHCASCGHEHKEVPSKDQHI